jgi:hypothetical protein
MHFTFLPILMMCLGLSFTHHIIFEQVGEMASAVTYLHVKFEVSFTEFQDHYDAYVAKLNELHKAFEYDEKFFKIGRAPVSAGPREIILNHLRAIRALAHRKRTQAKSILNTFQGIRNAMPKPDSTVGRLHKISKREDFKTKVTETITKSVVSSLTNQAFKHSKTIIRQPRGLISLGLGALGTFMGLYNMQQIRTLQKDLEQTQDAHNRLVEVVQVNTNQIIQLNNTVDSLIKAVNFTSHFDMATLTSQIYDIENELKARLNQIIHTVQKAQDHRLAMDYLPADELSLLFEKVRAQAKAIGHQLLTTQPSDLFQLELSYFSDGNNMQLLLHVPSVPKDSLLRLFKLHPFPLPINQNYSTRS